MFCSHLDGEERAGCITFVFVMSCDYKCLVTFPNGVVGLSAVCDCGISRSYSIYESIVDKKENLKMCDNSISPGA